MIHFDLKTTVKIRPKHVPRKKQKQFVAMTNTFFLSCFRSESKWQQKMLEQTNFLNFSFLRFQSSLKWSLNARGSFIVLKGKKILLGNSFVASLVDLLQWFLTF